MDEGRPENSLAAFKAAAEKGYGVELDVQLSKDGHVMVFHDDSLSRMCGVEGNIWDFDLAELKQMRLLGTEESIPLFTEVLEVLRSGAGPLIVELKNGPVNAELCQKTYEILKTYEKPYCIESFNPLIVKWFKKNAKGVFRGQLSQQKEFYPEGFGKFVVWMLSGCRLSFLNKPDFIAYKIGQRPARILRKRKKGVLLFAWTSRQEGADQAENDSVIFEGYLPPLKY